MVLSFWEIVAGKVCDLRLSVVCDWLDLFAEVKARARCCLAARLETLISSGIVSSQVLQWIVLMWLDLSFVLNYHRLTDRLGSESSLGLLVGADGVLSWAWAAGRSKTITLIIVLQRLLLDHGFRCYVEVWAASSLLFFILFFAILSQLEAHDADIVLTISFWVGLPLVRCWTLARASGTSKAHHTLFESIWIFKRSPSSNASLLIVCSWTLSKADYAALCFREVAEANDTALEVRLVLFNNCHLLVWKLNTLYSWILFILLGIFVYHVLAIDCLYRHEALVYHCTSSSVLVAILTAVDIWVCWAMASALSSG